MRKKDKNYQIKMNQEQEQAGIKMNQTKSQGQKEVHKK